MIARTCPLVFIMHVYHTFSMCVCVCVCVCVVWSNTGQILNDFAYDMIAERRKETQAELGKV
jgi:hypothetical protein